MSKHGEVYHIQIGKCAAAGDWIIIIVCKGMSQDMRAREANPRKE